MVLRTFFKSLCAGLLFSLAIQTAQAEDTAFLSVLDDVPLMAGLSEVTNGSVYFDTPSGRIVEVFAVGDVSSKRLHDYYKETLPSLGWQWQSQGVYEREGEFLDITVKMDQETAIVRYSLSPHRD